jgi:hypothetical protein
VLCHGCESESYFLRVIKPPSDGLGMERGLYSDAATSATHADVVIIGSGIAGLAAACTVLAQHPSSRTLVLEAADSIGGRARSQQLGSWHVDIGATYLHGGLDGEHPLLRYVPSIHPIVRDLSLVCSTARPTCYNPWINPHVDIFALCCNEACEHLHDMTTCQTDAFERYATALRLLRSDTLLGGIPEHAIAQEELSRRLDMVSACNVSQAIIDWIMRCNGCWFGKSLAEIPLYDFLTGIGHIQNTVHITAHHGKPSLQTSLETCLDIMLLFAPQMRATAVAWRRLARHCELAHPGFRST